MITPAVDSKGKTVGWLRRSGWGEWTGYMSKADAEANRYPVGFGTKAEALKGIARILAEMRAEQAFERRYA